MTSSTAQQLAEWRAFAALYSELRMTFSAPSSRETFMQVAVILLLIRLAVDELALAASACLEVTSNWERENTTLARVFTLRKFTARTGAARRKLKRAGS